MKPSTAFPMPRRRDALLLAAAGLLLAALASASLFMGKYPLSLKLLLAGDAMQLRVFWTLRVSRTLMGAFGGFCLGVAGFVYQTVFRNPLASPDVIGVSSGASAGAAAGILFWGGAAAVTLSAFAGALGAAAVVLGLAGLDRDCKGKNGSIVLAGIAVHALAQTLLMCLKLTADPERQLASIEYWIMGSLAGIRLGAIGGSIALGLGSLALLFLLHRQLLLLAVEESEARMLGVSVGRLRLLVVLAATLAVSAVVSQTGLVSFVGLLAPHGARLLTGHNKSSTMLLSGLLGGVLLCGADLLARSAAVELPVSIFTSLLGAPFLLYLIRKGRRQV